MSDEPTAVARPSAPETITSESGGAGLFSRTHAVTTGCFVTVMFLTGFAALAVVPTLPVAARDLHAVGLYPLVAGCFVAASLLGGVLGGDWADRVGAARPLAAGVALAVVTLLVSGASTSVWQLAAGRFMDGLAAGMVAVSVNTAIAQAYPTFLRPRALALMSTCWVIPSLVGPPLAGLVAAWWSWRVVFFGLAALNVLPAVAVVAVLRRRPRPAPVPTETGATGEAAETLKTLGEGETAETPETPREGETAETPETPREGETAETLEAQEEGETRKAAESAGRVSAPRPPLLVAAAVSAGAALAQYAVSGWDALHLLCGAAGLVLLAVFARRLLPRGTLRAARGLPATVLLRGLTSGTYFTLEAFVPLLLNTVRHVPPALTGLAFTGAAVAWAASAWVQGHLLDRVPRHLPTAAGAVLLAAAVALAAVGTLPALPALTGAVAMVVAAIGMGLLVPSLTLLSLSHSPPGRQGYAGGAMQTAQNLGQVAVLGIASAVFSAARSGTSTGSAGYGAAFWLLLAPCALTVLLAARAATRGAAAGARPGVRVE